jgi:hypothetical protein
MNQIFKQPIKKAHHVGTSVVVTIDQSHVKRLQIDDMTFFIQKPIENGIILEMCKLNISGNENTNFYNQSEGGFVKNEDYRN